MNTEDAKRILARYRPDSQDSTDSEMTEALIWLQNHPELEQWFESHCAFQRSVRNAFRSVPVPEGLSDRLKGEFKIVRIPQAAWWKRADVWTVAACFILLAVLSVFWFRPVESDSFALFRSRMVRTVLREYRMDIVTNNMPQIRQFLADNQAPADYHLTGNLQRMEPLGAGLLSWKGERVSMVCLDSGAKNTYFLFIVDRSAVKRPPPETPEFVQVNKLMTASWSKGDKTYMLAASGDAQQIQKNL